MELYIGIVRRAWRLILSSPLLSSPLIHAVFHGPVGPIKLPQSNPPVI